MPFSGQFCGVGMDSVDVSVVNEAAGVVALLREGLAAPQGFTLFLRGEGAQSAQQWKRVRLSAALGNKLSSQLIERIGRSLERDLAEYTYDDMTPSVLGVWRTKDISELSAWFGDIPDHTWAHIFDGSPEFEKTIRYQVFVIQTAHGSVRVFLKKGANAIVHKGIAASFSVTSNEFSEVSGKVFSFELGVDFFEFNGTVFVGNSSAFELVTHVRKITSERSDQIINSFNEKTSGNVVFMRRSELSSAIKAKPLFARKIASARVMGTIAALTAEKMIARISGKGLRITHKLLNGKYCFEVDENDPKSVRDFVDLITDTYLVSDVTDLEYKTHAKERV